MVVLIIIQGQQAQTETIPGVFKNSGCYNIIDWAIEEVPCLYIIHC